jgi:hypothetical protein
MAASLAGISSAIHLAVMADFTRGAGRPAGGCDIVRQFRIHIHQLSHIQDAYRVVPGKS